MLKKPEYLPETTESSSISRVIDNSLRSLHVAGSLLLRETYLPPWSIAIPDARRLSNLLGFSANIRAVAFHMVEFGQCEITPDGCEPAVISAGEMAICFGGQPHRLSQGRSAKPQAVETLLAGGPNLQRPSTRQGASGASLVCGVFFLQERAFNPLLSAMPSMVHSNLLRPGEMHNLSGVARLLAEELDREAYGSGYVVERLLEVLCAEAVRAHIESDTSGNPGWFGAIKDPVVGRSIAAIHDRPGADWSVKKLSRLVAMSPSRFAARFSAAVGESPMAYVTKWRMDVACRQLASTDQTIDQVASDLGYESLPAFSRAFKKQIGASPAKWRESARIQ